MATAQDVLDFLYGDSEYIGMFRVPLKRGGTRTYSKEDILDAMNKGLTFEDIS